MRAASVTDSILEVPGPRPFKRLDALDHLRGVADGPAERRVHRGDQRFGPTPAALPIVDERRGQRAASPLASS